MVRVMQGVTADAPLLKERAGVRASGRKLAQPYVHFMLSWPEGEEPSKEAALAALDGALGVVRLKGHYAIAVMHNDTRHRHVHAAISRVNAETGKAVQLDAGVTRRLSPSLSSIMRDLDKHRDRDYPAAVRTEQLSRTERSVPRPERNRQGKGPEPERRPPATLQPVASPHPPSATVDLPRGVENPPRALEPAAKAAARAAQERDRNRRTDWQH